MNLILKALNKEKTIIRQFQVSISKEHNFAVIHDYLPEYETFLPVLSDGIKSLSTNDVSIYCIDSESYSNATNIKKLKVSEEKVEVIESKIV